MSNEPLFQSLAFLGSGHLDLELVSPLETVPGLGDFRLTELHL